MTRAEGGGSASVDELGGEASARFRLVVGVLAAAVVVLRPAAEEFRYDASTYWNGAQAWLGGGDVYGQALLDLRGVLTSLIYVPAVAVGEVAGPGAAGFAVLAQNAALVAVLGVVLLPAVVRLWGPAGERVVLACAAGVVITLGGLTPYPLTDLWGAALLLGVVLLVRRRGRAALLLAGLSAGAAFNVRPASLVPLVLIVLAVLAVRRIRGMWTVMGIIVALAPQVAVNRSRGGTWIPWPVRTGELTGVQSSFGSYIVRYDTLVGDVADPRRWYCSPGMAAQLGSDPPSSTGEEIGAFFSHPLHATWFVLQKLGAVLHWPAATPYAGAAPGANVLLAIAITWVTVVGCAVLVVTSLRDARSLTLAHWSVAAIVVGALGTVATSVPENRFAIPLVLLGITGCALLVASTTRPEHCSTARMLLAATGLSILLFGIGSSALAYPVGGVPAPSDCAAA